MSTGLRRIAAIDIGTVTTRLLVADVDGRSITEVDRSTDITHLGEGLPKTGSLSPEAMQRVADVVGGYVDRIDELAAEDVIATATSASRDAANGEEFLRRIADAGLKLQIISGEREARLSFAGATFGREGRGLLVVDIGGGSTELVLGDSIDGRPTLERALSIDVGSRRITEMFLLSDPPTPQEISRAREYVRTELAAFFTHNLAQVETAISVAGTATTLSAIDMEMREYDPARVDGSVLTSAQIRAITDRLALMDLADRKSVVGLHPERAYVIVAGGIILGEVLDLAGLDSTTVSERDILYGMLLEAYRHTR